MLQTWLAVNAQSIPWNPVEGTSNMTVRTCACPEIGIAHDNSVPLRQKCLIIVSHVIVECNVCDKADTHAVGSDAVVVHMEPAAG